ncbi:actin-associated protein FAM107A [Spinachia spinachia]
MAKVLTQQPHMKDQYSTDNRLNAESSSNQTNPAKPASSHNELHKELLLAHKRGVALNSRSELQRVMDRRKRVQNDREEEGNSRTPLENVLLRHQQRQLEREREEKVGEEAQLVEFLRVRQNLRKIHSAMQNKTGNI